jgi:hypothetical protein
MTSSSSLSRGRILLLALLAGLACLLLDLRPLAAPALLLDDFQILRQSWTWERTWSGLWLPQNEHAMPLGRLLTFVLEWLAGRPTALPRACSLLGPAALLAGLPLVYQLVRQQTGQPALGLLAVILFAVSSVYNQAVYLFAAAFAILSLDTLLLALLAAQRWRRTQRWYWLALCGALTALAPGWFALGVLGGPLCALYLLASRRDSPTERSAWAELRAALVPLLGTGLFLALSLPRTAAIINQLPHYRGQTAVAAFDPVVGLGYTLRALVDGLVLGAAGIPAVATPVWLLPAILAALSALAWWWWRRAAATALLWLGAGMMAGGYLLVYSARARWSYDLLVEPSFNRYHLLPHLGLVLFVCGGLPRRSSVAPAPQQTLPLGPRSFAVLLAVLAVCVVVQLPRGLVCCVAGVPSLGTLQDLGQRSDLVRSFLDQLPPESVEVLDEVGRQPQALQLIEEMDARCREQDISAEAARGVLEPLDIPGSGNRINGWDFLCGSPHPRQWRPEEVKRLLEGPR